MDWSKGYIADVGYTASFYRETAPSHMAFAALCLGKSAGRAMRPKRYLELGFGQGFGLALLAAANPDILFEGYDFNPEHVAHIRRLIDGAELANVKVGEISFEDAAARGGDNDVDVISLHGILSWVGEDSREAIVMIVGQRLQPEGIVYASYNCVPGWAPIAPMRQLMVQMKRRQAGRSEVQLNAALEVLNKLKAGGAAFFLANPAAGQQLDQMYRHDRQYLIHEYLDEHWHLFQFADMAAYMGGAKLAYHASATLLENLDQYAVPQALHPLIADTKDPVLKETLRDYAGNRRFRRDLFARGIAALTTAEHRRMLSDLRFVLTVPREKVTFKFPGPLSDLNARPDLHGPVLDVMADKVATFDELAAVFPAGEGRIGLLLDCLALQINAGQVLPIVATTEVDKGPAQRFNRQIVSAVKSGRIYNSLASPVARTGIGVGEFDLLALLALFDGQDSGAAAAKHALGVITGMGRRPVKDGKIIEDDATALGYIEERISIPLRDSVPVWRRLGVL